MPRTDLINLIAEYVTLFSDTPCTVLIEHNIDVRDATPIFQRYYKKKTIGCGGVCFFRVT